VKRTCLNPGYVGQRVHQGKVIGPAAWPAIVDEADWQVALRILTDPARGGRRESAVRSLLTGLARCGVCGGPMRVMMAPGKGAPSYLCFVGGPDAPGRFHTARRRGVTDLRVTTAIVARLSRPDLVDVLAEQVGDDAGKALAQVEALRARLAEFRDAATTGRVSLESFIQIEAQLLPQIADAEARARAATMSPTVAATAGVDAAARFEALALSQQREVITALAEVRVMPVGRGHRVFDPASVAVIWH
jgi:hypothetical protein